LAAKTIALDEIVGVVKMDVVRSSENIVACRPVAKR
jgi:hypothetical protein